MSETMRTFALNGVTYEIGGVSPEVLRSKVDRTEVGAAGQAYGGSYLQVTSDGTVTLLNAGNSQAAVDCLRHAQLGLHGIGGVSWAR